VISHNVFIRNEKVNIISIYTIYETGTIWYIIIITYNLQQCNNCSVHISNKNVG